MFASFNVFIVKLQTNHISSKQPIRFVKANFNSPKITNIFNTSVNLVKNLVYLNSFICVCKLSGSVG